MACEIKQLIILTCDTCGEPYDTDGEVIKTPKEARTAARANGWSCTNNNDKCPLCIEEEQDG